MPPTPSSHHRIPVSDPADPAFTPSDLRVPELRSLLATRNIRLPTSARKLTLIKAVEEAFGTPASAQSGRARGNEENDDDDEEAGNFSDQNVFQAGSGNEGTPKSKGEPRKGRKSAAAALSAGTMTKRKDVAVARRKTIDPSRLPSSSIRRDFNPSFTPPSAPPSRSVSTVFQNYMDPIVAKASPSRKLEDGTNGATPTTGKVVKRAPRNSNEAVGDGAEADVSGHPDTRGFPDTEDEDAEVENETPSKGRSHRRLPLSARHKGVRATEDKSWLAPFLRYLTGAAMLAWWVFYVRDSKIIGYCDTGSETNALLDVRSADYLRRSRSRVEATGDEDHETVSFLDLVPEALQARCTPCPPHANCAEGALKSCFSDEYIYHSSVLSQTPIVKDILPMHWLSDTCRTDSRRLEMIDELAGEIARQLGTWRGAVTCGSRPRQEIIALLSDMNKQSGSSIPQGEKDDLRFGVRQDDLFDALQILRDEEAVPSEQYFAQLWNDAIKELMTEGLVKRLHISASRGEVETAHGQVDEKEGAWPSGQDLVVILIPSASLASIPFGCRVRLTLRSLLRATILYLLGGLTIFFALLYIRSRLRHSRFASHKIDELSAEVLQRLAEQQMMSLHSDSQPPHLPANHLRDLLLPAARGVSPTVRKGIWTGVSKHVESNSNVRVGMKKWKGEYSRSWEWVGVVTPGYRGGGGAVAAGTTSPVSAMPTPAGGLDGGEDGDGGKGEETGGAIEEMVQSNGNRRTSYGLN